MVKAGAIITIVASVAGLITTGVATLTSAWVAEDQLHQSQEAAEEKRREQAARVSYWVDVQSDGTPRVHLMNRSPDPISTVLMQFYATSTDYAHFGKVTYVLFRVALASVPPCSDMAFTSKGMWYPPAKQVGDDLPNYKDPLTEPPKEPKAGWRSFKTPPTILAVDASFTDRNGQRWNRSVSHLIRGRLPVNAYQDGPGDQKPVVGRVQAVQPQLLKGCAETPAAQ